MQANPIKRCGLALSFVMSFLLAACGGSDKTSQAPIESGGTSAVAPLSGELNIYNWIEYLPAGLKENFIKQTGLKVNYDTFDTDEALNAKLIAGSTGYDIVVPGAAWAEKQIAQGKYQKLDKSKIPNWKNLDPALMAQIAMADPGNEYLIPWAWGFTAVGINEEKVKAALGDMPLPENPFDLVFKPEYTNKLKSCGIFMLDSPSEVLPAALQYLGKDTASTNIADFTAAGEMLKAVRKDIRKFGDSSVVNDIADGNLCVFLAWSGDINKGIKDSKNPAIKVLLGGGGIVFFDAMAIPSDAKNLDNAYAWINNYLDPKVGAEITNQLGFATANKASLEFVNPEDAANKTIFLSVDSLKSMDVRRLPATDEANKAMNEVFRQFKSGK